VRGEKNNKLLQRERKEGSYDLDYRRGVVWREE